MKDTALTESGFADKRAAEYRSRGYEVSRNVPLDFLPGFRADLVVSKDEQTTVIAVRTRTSLAVDSTIQQLAEILSSKPDWSFDLLLVAEPEQLDAVADIETLTPDAITQWIDSAQRAFDHGLIQAAFLTTWSACEAAVRELVAQAGLDIERVTRSDYLLTQAIDQGVISENEGAYLFEMLAYRNALAHGFAARDFTDERAKALIGAVMALSRALNDPERPVGQYVLPVRFWDPLNLRVRLDEFRNLEDGWLEGRGVALRGADLDWLDALFENRFPDDCAKPRTFATSDGGISMEWSDDRFSMELEIDLNARRGEFLSLNLEHRDLEHRDAVEFSVDLDDDEDWNRLIDQIRRTSQSLV